ncbi:hypothetical protein STRCI_000160 [Streptomyces cinnabarinus]|uniref:DUF4386 family protein n=1 Tax=Streptomyces cinnabarinus TaxID=67287 RepID=A0ABY7K864_9ACTN|nr:hypothetical protein [Streptomyces cinnabarinus]WAZ19129.1 hypothetical protein STRCI_000160 [Streptomyces cinnabarinus]
MSTSTRARTQLSPGPLLLLGGIAFFAGGAIHPAGNGEGSKVDQLHEMLVDSMWYPSHALMLVAMVCFAAAILAFRRRGGLGSGMARVTDVASVIAVVATAGMALHLFAALGADGIAHGEKTLLYHVQTWNETLTNPLWGLSVAALAVTGGLTRTLGNPLTLALGLVGGLAFALASATIAFTDRFDALFPLASLIGIWAVVVGLMTWKPGVGRVANDQC